MIRRPSGPFVVRKSVYLLFCFALALIFRVPAHAQENQKRSFNIPSDTADNSLKLFSAQSGRALLVGTEIAKRVRTNSVRGEYLPNEALALMLVNTRLVASQDEANGAFAVRFTPAAEDGGSNGATNIASKSQTHMNSTEKTRPPKKVFSWLTALVVSASSAGLAAQEEAPSKVTAPASAPDELVTLGNFVVTGTQIRGVEPVGTNFINLGRAEVQKTGAISSNDILSAIPQAGLFNQLPAPGADFGNAIIRPNIRNLGASGANTTLVLMNGHRIVGAGILQTTPDASVIPPGILERVEIVPDGGSAIYGSDAIGGVINFVTRTKFEGTEIASHYGVANDYFTIDANLASGMAWKEGSAVVSYVYAKHDAITGSDRAYFSSDHRPLGGSDQRTNFGSPGNITVGSTIYNASNFAPLAVANKYDIAKFASIYPEEERHSLFGSFNQALSEKLEISATGYWSQRKTVTLTPQATLSGSITSSNPYFRPIGTETSQTVASNYSSAFGGSNRTPGKFTSWGVTPEAIVKLPADWQIRIPLNYGESDNTNHDHTNISNTSAAAALAGTTLTTALNPYDLASSNPSVLAGIKDYEYFSNAKQKLVEGQAIADGTVFTGPGGNIKLAVGLSADHESIDARSTTGRIGSSDSAAHASASRNVKSVFTELNVPIIGSQNKITAVNAFRLALSARYDDYSDFGATTNPKVGFTYQPFAGLTMRANYGTAFNAPSLADTAGAVDSRAQRVGVSPWRAPNSPASDAGRPTILIAGGTPGGLKPQKAKTWSMGADWAVKQVKGLMLSATFYKIQFTDVISVTPFFNPAIMFSDPALAKFVDVNPTLEQMKARIGSRRLDGFASIESLYGFGNDPYAVYDAQRHNYGSLYTSGIDFSASYVKRFKNGEFHTALSGNDTLLRTQKTVPSSNWTDVLNTSGFSRVSTAASAGVILGGLDSTVSVTYTSAHDFGTVRIASFAPINLSFIYSVGTKKGWAKDLSVGLNINNVFNRNPPFQDGSTGAASSGVGTNNGAPFGTVGTEFLLGVRKRL